MITIVAIGKKHEPWVQLGIERFQKRLKQPFNVEWVLLPHSSLDNDSARQEESAQLRSRVSDDAFMVLLDERGTQLTSPALSDLCQQRFTHAKPLVFIIGGAYGVTEELRRRADTIWSLSDLVFPHQLVRLLLIEQLYRAQEISRGSSYHHE